MSAIHVGGMSGVSGHSGLKHEAPKLQRPCFRDVRNAMRTANRLAVLEDVGQGPRSV